MRVCGIRFPALVAAVSAGVSLLALAGCATVTNPTPGDPFESANRTVFKFNDAVDHAVLKPVAQGYNWLLPQFARTGVTNFFGNFGDDCLRIDKGWFWRKAAQGDEIPPPEDGPGWVPVEMPPSTRRVWPVM